MPFTGLNSVAAGASIKNSMNSINNVGSVITKLTIIITKYLSIFESTVD